MPLSKCCSYCRVAGLIGAKGAITIPRTRETNGKAILTNGLRQIEYQPLSACRAVALTVDLPLNP